LDPSGVKFVGGWLALVTGRGLWCLCREALRRRLVDVALNKLILSFLAIVTDDSKAVRTSVDRVRLQSPSGLAQLWQKHNVGFSIRHQSSPQISV
jgi:hypothetical protein